MRNDLTHRAASLVSLALFLVGSNFCLVAAVPAKLSAAKRVVTSSAAAKAVHGCCAAAAAKASRDAEATRQATAPCCVAVSPIVVSHGASVEPAPALAFLATLAPFEFSVVVPATERFVLREDARPPAKRAATPDAGRAPPRL